MICSTSPLRFPVTGVQREATDIGLERVVADQDHREPPPAIGERLNIELITQPVGDKNDFSCRRTVEDGGQCRADLGSTPRFSQLPTAWASAISGPEMRSQEKSNCHSSTRSRSLSACAALARPGFDRLMLGCFAVSVLQ